jgi:hypothetical protein
MEIVQLNKYKKLSRNIGDLYVPLHKIVLAEKNAPLKYKLSRNICDLVCFRRKHNLRDMNKLIWTA